MRELLGALLLVAAALAISWFVLGRIRSRMHPLHPMRREEYERRANTPETDASAPPPAADPIKSMEDAMRDYRDGYARPPGMWTPPAVPAPTALKELLKECRFGTAHGRYAQAFHARPQSSPRNAGPESHRQSPWRTLTRADALRRNLKGSR